MKTKPTPGPWHATECFVRPSKSDGTMNGNTAIAKMCRETKKALIEEQKANARLIAAAPELLMALEGVLSAFRTCIGDEAFNDFVLGNNAVIAAHVAIAKATGGAE